MGGMIFNIGAATWARNCLIRELLNPKPYPQAHFLPTLPVILADRCSRPLPTLPVDAQDRLDSFVWL